MVGAIVLAAALAQAPPAGPKPLAFPLVVDWSFSMRHLELFPYAPAESSAPVVDGDTLFVASSRGRSVYALDVESGAVRWSYRTRGRVEATVAVGASAVYAADAKGRVHAIDRATGKAIWRAEVGGVCNTALVHDPGDPVSRVLVALSDNRLRALDASNGMELWTYRREPPADLTIEGTSSPVEIQLPEGPAYVVGFSDGHLAAVRPDNGTPVWETKLVGSGRFRDVDGSVTEVDGRLYVTAYDDRLHVLEAATGRELWSAAPGGATGVVVQGGTLYHGTDRGEVVARDPADGRERWTWRLPAGVPTQPRVVDGYLFVASSSRSFYALRAETGEKVWSFDPGFRVSGAWARPAASGSRVFFTSNVGTVYAFEPTTQGVHVIGTWDSGPRRE